MRQFFTTSLLFLLGLAATVFAADQFLGWRIARHHGSGKIGPDVYAVVERLRRTDAAVRVVYLGDSVARQMFRPGTEARADVRFLASNQAISMAGQFYLLE